jgi:hypothetical protein
MKIDYAIVSSNDEPMYLDFWEIVRDLWIKKIGIKPILVKIDNVDEVIDGGDFIIHKIKKVEGVNTGFQSQIARLYVTKSYQDKVCLISDIDMLPLSKNYFVDNIKSYEDESMIIFSSDAYGGIGRYPMCYNAAKGSLFDEILNLDSSFESFCSRLLSLNLSWDTDEIFLGRMIDSYKNNNKIIKLKRGWVNGIANHRIDRASWNYSISELQQNNYIDCHSLRPLSQYKIVIDNLLRLL